MPNVYHIEKDKSCPTPEEKAESGNRKVEAGGQGKGKKAAIWTGRYEWGRVPFRRRFSYESSSLHRLMIVVRSMGAPSQSGEEHVASRIQNEARGVSDAAHTPGFQNAASKWI